jgi:hypothetical protein
MVTVAERRAEWVGMMQEAPPIAVVDGCRSHAQVTYMFEAGEFAPTCARYAMAGVMS